MARQYYLFINPPQLIDHFRRKRACKGPESRASTLTARRQKISLVGAQNMGWGLQMRATHAGPCEP